MALTFSTGLTSIANGDNASMTNYAFYRESGTGGAGSLVHSTDFFREGTGAVSYRVQANWEAGILFDYYTQNGSAVLDMTTGNRHLFLWFNHLNVAFLNTAANNGIYVIATSDAGTSGSPTNYARWVIGGGPGTVAQLLYPGGWRLVVIDLNTTPTNSKGSGCNVAQIRRLGIGVTSISGTVKTENLYLDAMWYGVPNYKVVGDGSTVCGWQDFINHSETNANGLIEDLGGAVRLSTGIQFGDSGQSNTTTFSSASGRKLFFRRHLRRSSGGAVIDSVNYAQLYKVTADGASTPKTSVTFGNVVGSGDARQGVLGGGISLADTTNMTWSMDFGTNIANLSNVKLYGVDLNGCKGGLLLDDASKTSVISCGFVNCGEIVPGTIGNGAEMLNCAVIDPLGGTNNRGLRLPSAHNIKQISCITSGSPTTQHMLHMNTAGTYSVVHNALVMYGDYSSGSLWHGEASGNNAGTITMAQSNGANATPAEINKTGTPAQSVDVSTSIELKMIVTYENGDPVVGAFAYIDDNDSTPFLLNTTTNASGEAGYTHTTGAVTGSRWRVRKYGYKQFRQIVDIGSVDITLYVTLVADPQQY